MDLIFIAATLAFFGVCATYVSACDRARVEPKTHEGPGSAPARQGSARR